MYDRWHSYGVKGKCTVMPFRSREVGGEMVLDLLLVTFVLPAFVVEETAAEAEAEDDLLAGANMI